MNNMVHGVFTKKLAVSIVLLACGMCIIGGGDGWAYSIEYHLHHLATPTTYGVKHNEAIINQSIQDNTLQSNGATRQSTYNHITNHLQSMEVSFASSITKEVNQNNAESLHIYSHIVADSTQGIVIITDLEPTNIDTISILLYLTSILKTDAIPINVFVLYAVPSDNTNQYINNAYKDFLSKTGISPPTYMLLLDNNAQTNSMQIDIGTTPIPSYDLLSNILRHIPPSIQYIFPSFWRSGTRINLAAAQDTTVRSAVSLIQQHNTDVDAVQLSLPTQHIPTEYGVESFDEFVNRYQYAAYLQSVIEALAQQTATNDIDYIVIPFVSGTNLINDTNIVGSITIILLAIIVMVSVRSERKKNRYLSLLYKSIDNFVISTVLVVSTLLTSSYLLHLFIAQTQIWSIVFEHAIWFFLLLLCIWFWVGSAATYLLLGSIRITNGRTYGIYALVVSCISALCFTIINAYFAIVSLFVVVGISTVLNIKSIDLKRNIYISVLLGTTMFIGCLLIISGNDLAYSLVTTSVRTNIVFAIFVLPLYFYNTRLLIIRRSMFQIIAVKIVLLIITLIIAGRIAYLII